MGSLSDKEAEVGFKPLPQIGNAIAGMQSSQIVPYRVAMSSDRGLAKMPMPSFPVQEHSNVLRPLDAGRLLTCELTTPIGVEDTCPAGNHLKVLSNAALTLL